MRVKKIKLEDIQKQIVESIDVKSQILEDPNIMGQVRELAQACSQSLQIGGKVAFCGNGGSFADAQHLSAEFTSRFLFDRPGLASITLGTNSSTITAVGNDYGFEDVFSREIESVLKPEDILIAITTSGKSPNILKALSAAKRVGVVAFALSGQSGGQLPSDISIIKIPSHVTARIQECHILIGHIICGLVEFDIFGSEASDNE